MVRDNPNWPPPRPEYIDESVNHPAHYTSNPSGVECITVVEHMSFNIGNAVKYLWRAGHKNGIEDLKKAAWYVNREIERLTKDVQR
jgi:hypothetical protein